MPRVFRQQYTRPIPQGAERTIKKIKRRGALVEVAAVRFKGDDGRWVVAPIVESGKQAGTHCRVESPTWYGRVKGTPVPLCTNKAAAETMLSEKIRKAERGEAGLVDPFETHRKRPLSEHLADFRRELTARDNVPAYVDMVVSRLESLFKGCQFRTAKDFDADKVSTWLCDLRRTGPEQTPLPTGQNEFIRSEVANLLGIKPFSIPPLVRRYRLPATGKGKARRYPRQTVEQLQALRSGGVNTATSNAYLSHLKNFCNWLVSSRKLPSNPFAHLQPGNADADVRHARRELTAEELQKVLQAARNSKTSFRGLSGEDRFHLYACACGTGFRASALAGLTPECFDLDGKVPTVTLPIRKDKSRKGKIQPLPADVADLLRDYLRDKKPGKPIWHGTGTWAKCKTGADMLRIDLHDAGIPYVKEGPDGPEHADFHALRHTYLTLGARAGIDLRTLQELAGHSTPELTTRYSHKRLHDLATAVEKLGGFLPVEAISSLEDSSIPYTPLTQTPDGQGRNMMEEDGKGSNSRDNVDGCKVLKSKELEGDRGKQREGEGRAGDRIRTDDVQLGNVVVDQDNLLNHKEVTPNDSPSLPSPYSDISTDLSRVVAGWNDLPDAAKEAILLLMKTCSPRV